MADRLQVSDSSTPLTCHVVKTNDSTICCKHCGFGQPIKPGAERLFREHLLAAHQIHTELNELDFPADKDADLCQIRTQSVGREVQNLLDTVSLSGNNSDAGTSKKKRTSANSSSHIQSIDVGSCIDTSRSDDRNEMRNLSDGVDVVHSENWKLFANASSDNRSGVICKFCHSYVNVSHGSMKELAKHMHDVHRRFLSETVDNTMDVIDLVNESASDTSSSQWPDERLKRHGVLSEDGMTVVCNWCDERVVDEDPSRAAFASHIAKHGILTNASREWDHFQQTLDAYFVKCDPPTRVKCVFCHACFDPPNDFDARKVLGIHLYESHLNRIVASQSGRKIVEFVKNASDYEAEREASAIVSYSAQCIFCPSMLGSSSDFVIKCGHSCCSTCYESKSGGEILCWICNLAENSRRCVVCKDPSSVYCCNCDDYLCQRCAGAHRIVKLTKSHELKECEEAADICQCSVHNLPGSAFCVNCSMVLCSNCDRSVHEDHCVKNIDMEHGEILKPTEIFAKLEDAFGVMQERLHRLETLYNSTEKYRQLRQQNVHGTLRDLKRHITKSFAHVKRNVQMLLVESDCQIEHKKKLFAAKISIVESLLSKMSEFANDGNIIATLTMHRRLKEIHADLLTWLIDNLHLDVAPVHIPLCDEEVYRSFANSLGVHLNDE